MDAELTANADLFEPSISMIEARELAELVDACGYWELIGGRDHPEPMKFFARSGYGLRACS